MTDLTVVLDRRNLVVRMDGGAIRVDQPGCNPERVPLKMIRQVVVIGRPMISCKVWRALASEDIPAVLLPSRGDGPPAYMSSGLSKTINTRLAQYRALNDPAVRLAVSRWLLDRKLIGQELVLKEMDEKDATETYRRRISTSRAALPHETQRDRLMGLEGTAAGAYFKALATLLPQSWHFEGRNRRPPRDPVNALLSLSYVIAGGEVRRAIQKAGMDPCLGCLHAVTSGRESLMLDAMEPIRPDIDRFVLALIQHRLTPTDFWTNDKVGCRLTKAGRRAYYEAWAIWNERDDDEMPNVRGLSKEIIEGVVRLLHGVGGENEKSI